MLQRPVRVLCIWVPIAHSYRWDTQIAGRQRKGAEADPWPPGHGSTGPVRQTANQSMPAALAASGKQVGLVWLHCPTLWPSWMSGSAAGQQLAGLRQLRGRWRSIQVPVFRRTDGRLDGTSTRVTATKRCDEADAGQVFDRTCGTESRVGLFGRVSFFPQQNRWFPGCTRRVYRHTRSIKPRRQAMFRNEINHVPFRLVSVGWCTDRTFSPLSRRPL